jgi:hypothetical protein
LCPCDRWSRTGALCDSIRKTFASEHSLPRLEIWCVINLCTPLFLMPPRLPLRLLHHRTPVRSFSTYSTRPQLARPIHFSPILLSSLAFEPTSSHTRPLATATTAPLPSAYDKMAPIEEINEIAAKAAAEALKTHHQVVIIGSGPAGKPARIPRASYRR